MVVVGVKEIVYIFSRNPMRKNVMDSLDVEGFFDFGVGRDMEVKQHQRRNQKVEKKVQVCHDVNHAVIPACLQAS